MKEETRLRREKQALPYKWTYPAGLVHYSVTLKLKAYNDRLWKEVAIKPDHEDFPIWKLQISQALEVEARRILKELGQDSSYLNCPDTFGLEEIHEARWQEVENEQAFEEAKRVNLKGEG